MLNILVNNEKKTRKIQKQAINLINNYITILII